MPLDRLVLIIVIVLAAAFLSIWLGAALIASFNVPFLGLILLPVTLVAYICWRVIAQRLNNPEEDHYDRMDH